MEADGKKYTVAVIATMSAGKSTLLNAMMCEDLLPSQNEACTSTVFRIEDNDQISHFESSFIEGRSKSEWNVTNKELLTELNKGCYREIEIRGNLPNIKNYKNSRVVFFDTPGPNNAMEDSHEKITKKIIRRADFCNLICVLNSSVMGVNDEWRLLQLLQKEIDKSERKIRPIFVLNKIDVLEQERGESVIKLVKEASAYLKDCGFKTPIVIPCCSLLSLWIRRCIKTATRMTAREVMGDYRGAEKLKSLFSRRYKSTLPCRLQMKLRTLLLEFKELQKEFETALTLTKEERDIYQLLANKSYPNQRRWIKISGEYFRYSDLYKVDLLAGVPIIETILEKKLISFDKNNQGEKNVKH